MAPSPKTATATSSVPRVWNESAAPAATGMPPPMIAEVGRSPNSMLLKCIEPPTPPQHPTVLPMISPKTDSGLSPSASAIP